MLIIIKIAEIKILNTDMVTEEILHNFEKKRQINFKNTLIS